MPTRRWLPPPSKMCKVNVDTAISKNSNVSVVVAVARDTNGVFFGASTQVNVGHDQLENNISSCLQRTHDVGERSTSPTVQRFRLATDCANAAMSINGLGTESYDLIIREIQARREDLQTIKVVHENRKSNVDAHLLAKSLLFSQNGRHFGSVHFQKVFIPCTIFSMEGSIHKLVRKCQRLLQPATLLRETTAPERAIGNVLFNE